MVDGFGHDREQLVETDGLDEVHIEASIAVARSD